MIFGAYRRSMALLYTQRQHIDAVVIFMLGAIPGRANTYLQSRSGSANQIANGGSK
jgi:hypothetical protein